MRWVNLFIFIVSYLNYKIQECHTQALWKMLLVYALTWKCDVSQKKKKLTSYCGVTEKQLQPLSWVTNHQSPLLIWWSVTSTKSSKMIAPPQLWEIWWSQSPDLLGSGRKRGLVLSGVNHQNCGEFFFLADMIIPNTTTATRKDPYVKMQVRVALLKHYIPKIKGIIMSFYLQDYTCYPPMF